MRARVAARNRWQPANPTSAKRAASGTLGALGKRGVDARAVRLIFGVMSTTKIIERGDIFASPCRVLVNPVNCVGVSGKGLAKEFKKRFPLSVKAYEKDIRDASNGRSGACGIWPGSPTEYEIIENDKIVMFFATKLHWKDKSELQHIDEGLDALVGHCEAYPDRYPSIAIPGLGCGLGQLAWSAVLPLLIDATECMNNFGVDVEIYAPLEGT